MMIIPVIFLRDLGELQCNAHANNMVVLDPRCSTEGSVTGDETSFLGYLDLDMAFELDSFVDINVHEVSIHLLPLYFFDKYFSPSVLLAALSSSTHQQGER